MVALVKKLGGCLPRAWSVSRGVRPGLLRTSGREVLLFDVDGHPLGTVLVGPEGPQFGLLAPEMYLRRGNG